MNSNKEIVGKGIYKMNDDNTSNPNLLEDYINFIEKTNKEYIKKCSDRFDTVAKPLGGLGAFEGLVSKIGGIQETVDVNIYKRCLLVFCSDNGVVKQNISQSDSSVTLEIAKSLVRGSSSVAVMAKKENCDTYVIDVGMIEDVEGCIKKKYCYSTNDISDTYAMLRKDTEKIIIDSINMVKELKEKGYKIIATGEAGIGNTTTSAAVASALLDLEPEIVTGKGAGLTTDGLKHKIEIVKRAIDINNPNNDDPIDVLSKLGGGDIVAMTGVFLGGAIYKIPIIMDGVISSVAALCANRLSPLVKDYIIPSHMSMEPAMKKVCEELELKAVIHADMHLGEGTGAVMMLPLLDLALTVYNDAAKFTDINVEQYEDYSDK